MSVIRPFRVLHLSASCLTFLLNECVFLALYYSVLCQRKRNCRNRFFRVKSERVNASFFLRERSNSLASYVLTATEERAFNYSETKVSS